VLLINYTQCHINAEFRIQTVFTRAEADNSVIDGKVRLDQGSVSSPMLVAIVVEKYVQQELLCGDIVASNMRKSIFIKIDVQNIFVIYEEGHLPTDLLQTLTNAVFVAALWNRAGHYILPCDFYLSIFFFCLFSLPNLSGRRLDVYHTGRPSRWALAHILVCTVLQQLRRFQLTLSIMQSLCIQ